jgi:hypothetical protein
MAADAWHEFSGWDGRFVCTFRRLAQPGALTLDVLEGRRARYVAPLRLYLVASVFYFLMVAAFPGVQSPIVVRLPGSQENLDFRRPIPAAERAAAQKQLDRAPVWARALIQPMLDDPERQRREFVQNFPRALFVLVPVFAGIVGLFHWRRGYAQHLIFALHLSAAIFLVFGLAHLTNLAGSRSVLRGSAAIASAIVIGYTLAAFRRVYRDRWLLVVLKAAGIGFVYLIVLSAAILITYAWTVLI